MSILKSLSRGETDIAKFVRHLSIITHFPHRYTDGYNKTARTKARVLEKMMKFIVPVIPQFVSLNYFQCVISYFPILTSDDHIPVAIWNVQEAISRRMSTLSSEPWQSYLTSPV